MRNVHSLVDDQQLFAREMQHRLRNTIAVLQAIVTQTLRRAESKELAEEIIAERLSALARANDLLFQEKAEGINLHDTVRNMLDVFDDTNGSRFEIDGPSVFVDQHTSVWLALILHEMATNATKYGALSNDRGHVELNWTLSAHIHLHWSEHDGPTVDPPSPKGFGTQLIRNLLHGPGSSSQLSFPMTGAVLDLEIPATNSTQPAPLQPTN